MYRRIAPALACALLFGTLAATAQPVRDGMLFDAGIDMIEPSPRAPDVLDDMDFILGSWTVEITTHSSTTSSLSSSCRSRVTYANRGFAFMERLYCQTFQNRDVELNTLSFLTFAPSTGLWRYGVANSVSESISVYDGEIEDEALILRTSIRRRGTAPVTHERMTVRRSSSHGFAVLTETSVDERRSWRTVARRTYVRDTSADGFMNAAQMNNYGVSAPGRPPEANQFDFLLGTWDAQQEIQLAPSGETAEFPSTTTAIRALNGHAILEHMWYNADDNLPDAATSVVRIYNRTMRRWESLYVDNRSNNPLFFGGRKEADRMVLTLFEADRGSASYSYFVFHDIERDHYSWHAEVTTDFGQTFNTTWTIVATRRP